MRRPPVVSLAVENGRGVVDEVSVTVPVGGGNAARDAAIADLYRAGATQESLAEQFGISQQRVSEILRKARATK